MCGKGLELHRLHFGWSREELCCSFLKEKEKNLYHLPHFPGITSFGEFSMVTISFSWLISKVPTKDHNPKTLLLSLLLRIHWLVPSHRPRKHQWRVHAGKFLFLFLFCFRFPSHGGCTHPVLVPWGSRQEEKGPSPMDREEVNWGSSVSALPTLFSLLPTYVTLGPWNHPRAAQWLLVRFHFFHYFPSPWPSFTSFCCYF